MKNYHNEHHTRQPTKKLFDIKSSEFNSSKKQSKKATNNRKFGDEVDPEYAWLLNCLNENIEHSKPPIELLEEEEEEEEEEDDDDVSEDSNDKDPQYSMFLKNLTSNGKSYKLKISKTDESPRFLEYEGEYDPSTDMNFTIGDNGDETEDMEIDKRVKRSPNGKKKEISMKKEVSRKIKTEPKNNTTVDSCYQLFLEGYRPSEYGAFTYEGKPVNYEEKSTDSDSDSDQDSDSDSDMLIWDNVQDLSEVNKKQVVPEKKEPSLREKLMRILRKPYSEKEYKKLSKYIKQEKPICRLLPLRDRAISSALDGVTKSVLDDAPASFQKKLKAAQNDRPRTLNLLRMFLFWLQHLPNENIFTPWLREDFLEVLPSTHKRSCVDK